MSPTHPESASQNVITIRCFYCGHTWTESIPELERRRRVVYRDAPQDSPGRQAEYRVVCPHCGRKMVVSPMPPRDQEP